MPKDRDALLVFYETYLEYMDGDRESAPSLQDLTESERHEAELWLRSLSDARGIDPYASRPSASELLARVDAREHLCSDDTIRRKLENGLQNSLDPGAFAALDTASTAAGLASRVLIRVRGLRIRVVLEPGGADLAVAFRNRLGEVASVFGAFPDTNAVLITSCEAELKGTVVDRYDVVVAIETPSGQAGLPRLSREVADAVVACTRFVNAAMPAFESFRYVAAVVPGHRGRLLDIDRIARDAIRDVVDSGSRAQIEAKRNAWSTLGPRETTLVSGLLDDAVVGPMNEEEYRRRLEEAVEAA